MKMSDYIPNSLSTMASQMFSSQALEEFIMAKVEKIIEQGPTMTQPGSLNYLMYGSEPSQQSISIKMGKIGEEIVKIIISRSPNLELLQCGTQCIDPHTKKNKDLDLLWKDERNKTIYYREAKANIELDSEKLPATIDKVTEIIETFIKPSHPDYTINVGVYNWSIYRREILKKGLSQIKKCESKGIKVEHPEDLFKLLDFEWSEEDYNTFFHKVGGRFRE